MIVEQVSFVPNFPAWQKAARFALQQDIPPEEIVWQDGHDSPALDLFDESDPPVSNPPHRFRVPKKFLELAPLLALRSDERRWALLYRLLWRITHGEPKLLEISIDPDAARAFDWHKSVRHDIHKMRPDRCAHWNQNSLTFTDGADQSHATTEDEIENLWLTYYGNIFNPARVKVHTMQAEIPKKYWRNLPETALISTLRQEAPGRVDEMMKKNGAKFVAKEDEDWQPAPTPETSSLTTLKKAAKACTACHLFKHATQTVFGEGPKGATLMLLGEQPGDQEDLAGKPFVGPAGGILNRALEEAGIDRTQVYVTNTVKHFKWEPRGKRRIHKKPNSREIAACRPWLEAELRVVRPNLLVCMGATAAQAIFGPSFRVTRERGKVLQSELAAKVVATVHPSSLLRQPDEESREREYKLFVADLRTAVKAAE